MLPGNLSKFYVLRVGLQSYELVQRNFGNLAFVKPGHRIVHFGWVSYVTGGIMNERLCCQISI